MTLKLAGIVVVVLAFPAGIAGAQTRGPVPLSPPTVYSAPTPAPLVPPINPGPAVVPPAGLSPLLAEPGPVCQMPEREGPSYPPPQLPALSTSKKRSRIAMVCAINNGGYSVNASVRAASAAAKSSSN
jgi:hypothetical protein